MTVPRWFMEHPGFQRTDMQRAAQRCANTTAAAQQIFVPMNNGATHPTPGEEPPMTLFAHGKWWRLDETIEPDTTRMFAGLPEDKFLWDS